MREKVVPALFVGLWFVVLAAGCSGSSDSVLDSGTSASGWVGVYAGDGDILSVVNGSTCTGAMVEVTLLPDGNGGLLTEIWWEQAQQSGQECPYEVQCAPASGFNNNDGGSCSVFNLAGRASETQFIGEEENGVLSLTLSLDRAGDQVWGRLVTQPLTYEVVPHGEINFRLDRCESLPCPH